MEPTNKSKAVEKNSNNINKTSLQFIVRSGEREKGTAAQELIYYFDLDDNSLPIKVGDGTFGVVFRVLNASNFPYAVKILYNAKETILAQAKSL